MGFKEAFLYRKFMIFYVRKLSTLEEENYNLKSYLKDKNLEEDYQTYSRNLNSHNIEFER